MIKLVTTDGVPVEEDLLQNDAPLTDSEQEAMFAVEAAPLTAGHDAAQDARRRAGLKLMGELGLSLDEPFSNQDIQSSVDHFLFGMTFRSANQNEFPEYGESHRDDCDGAA